MNSSKIPELYRGMLLLRRFELTAQDLYRRGSIPGFIHLYVGEEAVATGVCAHLNADDYVTSTHRGHGHALAKGVPPREVMAELWGRVTGCSRGRGGSMHLYDPDHGLLGTNGLVAAGIPIASGAALAAQLRGTRQVAIAFFGDGAVNHGAFHEGINLAATWNLPAVFVCENNLYATETPFRIAAKNQDIGSRSSAYSIPGKSVDGNDVEAVYDAAGAFIEAARAGNGPALLECRTYRFVGHHEGDPGTGYRPKEEVDAWKARCPIQRLRGRAVSEGTVSEKEFKKIDEEVESVIAEAVKFSDASAWPEHGGPGYGVFPPAAAAQEGSWPR